MGLSDLNFLLRFFPVFYLLFFLVPRRCRNMVLLAGSLVFYSFQGWRNLLVLAGSLAVTYLLVLLMEKSRTAAGRRGFLAAAVICQVGLLCYFKYAAEAMAPGISFYTFMLLSYVFDVYAGRAQAAQNIWSLGIYAAMFPKVLSGPVTSYGQLSGQVKRERCVRTKDLEYGLSLLITGLAFKVIIADHLAILWHDIQTVGFETISTPLAWMGAACFSAQLFFDFQGYSLMAIGMARMMGFRIPANFNHPYRARSVSEFYRRWHISLGRWFRDYLYIPLGGNRKGQLRTACNLLVVWAVTGIWHGRTANYLLWGMVLGVLIVMERGPLGRFLGKHLVISRLYVFIVLPLTWVIFAVEDWSALGVYFSRLFPFFSENTAGNPMDWLVYGKTYIWMALLGLAVSVPAADRLWKTYWNHPVMKAALFVLFWFCIYQLKIGQAQPFLYFSF